jgi:hypothetical protein
MYFCLHVIIYYLLFILVRIKFFSTLFPKIFKYLIRLVEAKLFHSDRRTDGQTDRHYKAGIAFRSSANALKIGQPDLSFSVRVLTVDCLVVFLRTTRFDTQAF